jgi:thiamine-monophosphate kinase
MNEFSLIDQFFKSLPLKRDDVLLGIGDDAACIQIPANEDLLVSTDTLVSGIHFLPDWDAYDIACKSVMVNISDMAAMAAKPCWVTLALTLPELNYQWLHNFSRGLNDSLNHYNIDLIGGDTTKGPLSITLTIMGLCPFKHVIKRGGARAGDVIFVSGPLGAAALAVNFLNNQAIDKADKIELMAKLLHPKPRVDLRELLQKYASSAIDISDGLSADLNHICVASGVGASLIQDDIPVHSLLYKYLAHEAVDLALIGGDDYELCFTVAAADLDCYPIGYIEQQSGLRMITSENKSHVLIPKGYAHF